MSNNLPTQFKAVFVDFVDDDDYSIVNPRKWRIISTAHFGKTWSFDDSSRDLGFGTKEDCEQAIQSLARRGIVNDEGILSLSDEELGRICCENLRW